MTHIFSVSGPTVKATADLVKYGFPHRRAPILYTLWACAEASEMLSALHDDAQSLWDIAAEALDLIGVAHWLYRDDLPLPACRRTEQQLALQIKSLPVQVTRDYQPSDAIAIGRHVLSLIAHPDDGWQTSDMTKFVNFIDARRRKYPDTDWLVLTDAASLKQEVEPLSGLV